MVRNLRKTCNVCFKEMRGDKLKKHMKKHDVKTEGNVVTKGVHDGKTGDNTVYCTEILLLQKLSFSL